MCLEIKIIIILGFEIYDKDRFQKILANPRIEPKFIKSPCIKLLVIFFFGIKYMPFIELQESKYNFLDCQKKKYINVGEERICLNGPEK